MSNMVPTEQTCPKCGARFIGSDVIGGRCPACMSLTHEDLARMVEYMEKSETEQPNPYTVLLVTYLLFVIAGLLFLGFMVFI